jgi:hypothetical protein
MQLQEQLKQSSSSIKKIKIQELTPKLVNNNIDISDRNITGILDLRQCTSWKVNDGEKYSPDQIYAKYESGTKINYCCSNYFIGAYLHAYNNHQDIIFSVNDLWSIITLMLSKYINDNSEALRSKIVTHDGQKKLTVVEFADSVDESLFMEKQWDFFFEQIHEQIKENTQEGVVDILENNFSVTNTFYKLFSTVTIMDSFKKYFEYGRMIMECGIPNVHLEGTRDDWVLLKTKIQSMSKFAMSESSSDTLNIYINKLSVIVDKCIDTYDGNIDVNFWNNIMTTEIKRIGSGGQTQTNMEGWITHFLQIYGKTVLDDIKNYKMSIPVKLENKLTNVTKDLTLYGAFTGITYNDELNAYRPQLSIVLYHHI